MRSVRMTRALRSVRLYCVGVRNEEPASPEPRRFCVAVRAEYTANIGKRYSAIDGEKLTIDFGSGRVMQILDYPEKRRARSCAL
jgi:hypothetical protein